MQAAQAEMADLANGVPAEKAYLDLLELILEQGDRKESRTGIGVRSIFGTMLRFDLSGGRVPLLTVRRLPWRKAVIELLWFLSGSSNIRPLLKQDVHIWTPWAYERFVAANGRILTVGEFEERILTDQGFASAWGDLGPIYGRQWRQWVGRDGRVHDQLAWVIDEIRTSPTSRRLLFHAWNVEDLGLMALPPCHLLYQFSVSSGGHLDLILYQRSADLPVGVPWNLFEAAVLCRMVAQCCGLRARSLVWMGADVHIYENQADAVSRILKRSPRGFPVLSIDPGVADIDAFQPHHFSLSGYDPHPAIPVPVAV